MRKVYQAPHYQNTQQPLNSRVKKPPFWFSFFYYNSLQPIGFLVGLCLLLSGHLAAQSISGNVFFDGNNNGSRDALETGFPGVVVNAYRAGALISSTPTDNIGNYTLTSGIATGISYRLEFILPAGYNDGAAGAGSSTSVQFAKGGDSQINLGIYVPNQCGTDGTTIPRIIAGCIPFGGEVTLASNAYDNHSVGRLSCSLTPHQDDLTKYEIGVPYAITIHKRQKLAILTTISTPNLSDFPSAPDGATAIYAVDYSGPDFTYKSYKLLAKLSNLGIDVSNQFPIAPGINNIGEYGLGGITISEDERFLYIINMGKGNLIRVDISGVNYQTIPAGGFTSTSQLPTVEIDIPDAIANCTNGRFRPSALRMYAGKLYIGGICDASASSDNSGLYAKIIEMNTSTGASRVVFSHDLTSFNIGDLSATNLPQARWKYPFRPGIADGNPGEKQPFFNDIGFDDTGSIIFTIVDRKVFTTDTNREPGYLLRTWRQDDGTFVLESDRQSGPFTSAALIAHSYTGQPANLAVDNGGPGTIAGPKWFFEQGIDIYNDAQSYFNHVNLANGGIFIMPGTKEVVVGFTDPGCVSTSGMRYFDWTNGTTKYGVGLTNVKYFSVTGMSAVCDPSPIEIGNYVWKDSNRDGIQDPDEPAIQGATVALYEKCSGSPIATAVTDATGNYYFSSATNQSTASHIYGLTLNPDSSYCLKVTSLGNAPLVNDLLLTRISPAPGETSGVLNTGQTLSNSDAFLVDGFPTISFTMNSAGQNNHTYDFGFTDEPCSLTTTATASTCDPTTDTYSLTVVSTVANSKEANTLNISVGGITRTFSTTVSFASQFTTVFSGLPSDGQSHTVTVSLPNCSTLTTSYTAPTGCKPLLSVNKQVDRSTAKVGDLLTYRLVLSNTGTGVGSITVRDSLSTGLSYVGGSASTPVGTTFTAGNPISLWNVPAISAGQSLTLTYLVRVDTTGILYNVAHIPGDTAKVCTSVPILMCLGDQFELTAPTGQSNYRWYKNGLLIPNQITNSLLVTEPGTYSLQVDDAGSSCPDYSCCPIIFEEDTLPNVQVSALRSTCLGNSPRNNGQLIISNFNATHTYQYSLGATFDSTASLSGPARLIPSDGLLSATLPNPTVAQFYTIRVYNKSGCHADVTVALLPTICDCPASICVPYVVQQRKRPRRIGDPVR